MPFTELSFAKMPPQNKNLDEQEETIRRLVRRHPSNIVVHMARTAYEEQRQFGSPVYNTFRHIDGGLNSFVISGISKWAILHSNPFMGSVPTWSEFRNLALHIRDYLLLDPVTFDPEVCSHKSV